MGIGIIFRKGYVAQATIGLGGQEIGDRQIGNLLEHSSRSIKINAKNRILRGAG